MCLVQGDTNSVRFGHSVRATMYLLSFDQNCLHLTIQRYLSSESYSHKYKKLSNIVIRARENITEKRLCSISACEPHIQLPLFIFRPITMNHLNSLTLIGTFNCLGSLQVTHYTAVRELPGSIPGSGKDIYVCCCCCCCCGCCCVLTFVLSKNIICLEFLQFLLQCLFICYTLHRDTLTM